jgi:hypothetical protein
MPRHVCSKSDTMPLIPALACCQRFGGPAAACGAGAPPPVPSIAGWGTAPAWAPAGSCCSPLADPGHRRRRCCRPYCLHLILLQLLLSMRLKPAWWLPAAVCEASCTRACGPPSRPAAGTAASCMQHKGGRTGGHRRADCQQQTTERPVPAPMTGICLQYAACVRQAQTGTHQ